MGDDLAAANVNRSYALAATNVAFFTFMLFFLYPRFENGRINPLLFQSTLVSRNRDSSHNSRAGHPGSPRCSSLKYAEYSRSSRLAIRAPRSGTYATNHGSGTLVAMGVATFSLVFATLPRGSVVRFVTRSRRRPLKAKPVAKSRERAAARGFKCSVPSWSDLRF